MDVKFEKKSTGIWMLVRKYGMDDWQVYEPKLDHEIILRRLKTAYL